MTVENGWGAEGQLEEGCRELPLLVLFSRSLGAMAAQL